MDVQELKRKRHGLIERMGNVLARASRENRALRPAEELDFDTLEAKSTEITRTLKAMTRFAEMERGISEERAGDGSLFSRCLMALARSRGNIGGAIEHATQQGDQDLNRALSASVASSGGFAVPTNLSQEFIEYLRPQTAVRRLNPRIVPLENGNVTLSRVNSGVLTGYTHENTNVNATQATMGLGRLTAKKTVCFVPISNDLLRYSPTASNIVRDDLLASASVAEDASFIRGDGTQDTPRGLRNQATTVLSASATVDTVHIDGDLGSAEAALLNANIRMARPGWILSTRTANFLQTLRNPTSGVRSYPEMDGGLLRGKPFVATTGVPTNLGTGASTEILLADFYEVVVGDYPVIIDASGKAAYIDAGGTLVSAFSSDQTVVRVVLQSDILLRHDAACTVLTGVNY